MGNFYEISCRNKITMKKIGKFDYIQINPFGQGGTMSMNSPKWYIRECQVGSYAMMSEKSQERKEEVETIRTEATY